MGNDMKPVAWAVFTDNGNIRIWSTDSEPVRKLSESEGLQLVPLYAGRPPLSGCMESCRRHND
jgi:hypothetical protein